MLIVVSSDRAFLGAAVSNLSARCTFPVIAAQSVGIVMSLLEDNDVIAVVTQGATASHPVTRSVGRRFPHVGCVHVTLPADWNAVVAALEERFASQDNDDSVVAHGLDELLGLLTMTRRSARIEVTAGSNYGQLVVRDGHIIDARSATSRGHEAAIRIMGWDDARVKSNPVLGEEAKPEIHLPISAAFHESAHRRDELGRLASRADVSALMGALQDFDGFAGALLADSDNRTPFVERGPMEESRSRRLWEAVDMCRVSSKGVAFWDQQGVVVATPLGLGRVLAAATERRDQLARLRKRTVDVADGLEDVIEGVCALQDDVAVVASLNWS